MKRLTWIEVLIILILLGALAVVIIPNVDRYIERAEIQTNERLPDWAQGGM